MAKSQHALIYRKVPQLLRQMRLGADMTQRDLAAKLHRPQTWVHKSEDGSRRVDIAEFLEWSIGCGIEPMEGFRRLLKLRG